MQMVVENGMWEGSVGYLYEEEVSGGMVVSLGCRISLGILLFGKICCWLKMCIFAVERCVWAMVCG